MKIDTMRRILLTTAIILCGLSLAAQDSTYTRTITVERDYQPTIQEAQKIQVQPEQVEETMTPVEVRYSEYTPILSPDHNVTPMSTPRQSLEDLRPVQRLRTCRLRPYGYAARPGVHQGRYQEIAAGRLCPPSRRMGTACAE